MNLQDILDRIRQHFATPPQHAPIQQGAIQQFTQPIVQQVQQAAAPFVQRIQQNQPVFQPQVTRHQNAPQGARLVSDYFQGRVIQPFQQGLQDIKKPGFVEKLMGGVQAVGAGVSATPEGIAGNTALGIAAGSSKYIRDKKPLDASIRQSITSPNTSLGTDVLGIKDPILAGVVDLATARSPKALIKDPTGIKSIKDILTKGKVLAGKQNIYRSPHQNDIQMLDEAATVLHAKNPDIQGMFNARKDINALLNTYIKERTPKAEYEALLKSPTENQINVINNFFKNADKPRPTITSGTSVMGLVGKSKGKRQSLSETPQVKSNPTGMSSDVLPSSQSESQNLQALLDLKSSKTNTSTNTVPNIQGELQPTKLVNSRKGVFDGGNASTEVAPSTILSKYSTAPTGAKISDILGNTAQSQLKSKQELKGVNTSNENVTQLESILQSNKTKGATGDINQLPNMKEQLSNSSPVTSETAPQTEPIQGSGKMTQQSANPQAQGIPLQKSISQGNILDQFKTGAFKDSTNNNEGDLFQGVQGKIDKAYTDVLDRFHPISVLGKKAGEDQAMRNALTGYYGTGSIGKYHTDFELSPILKSVDSTDLRAYTVAQRDAELAGRDIQGSNRGNSQQILDALNQKYGGNLQPLEQAATKLYDYQKNLVKTNLVDTGIMSKESFDSMTANNQKYIPFQRVMDQVDSYLGVPGKGAGSVGSQNVIKGIKGSTKEIKDPLQSIVENTYKIVGLGQRQKVAQTIVGLKDKLPEGMVQKATGDTTGKSVISVFENGKAVKYLVPKEVEEAAKGMTSDQMGTIVKILAAPTRVFRATATGANPEFALPNTARDLQSAFVNVGLNPLRFVSGLVHYIRKDNVYQEFLKSGGMTSRISLDKAFLNQSVKDLTGVKTKGIALTKPSEIYKMLEAVGQGSEQPTRIAAFQKGYNQALEAGKSVEEARLIGANAAQESSVNFARRGAKTQSINAIYAFLNARAQGTDRLIRAAKNDPVGVSLRAGLITAAPAIALYMHNRGFQSYNDPNVVSPSDKQNNYIFMLSDTPLEHFGGAQYIKIPKGDVGKLANPLEAFLSFADGKGGDVQSSLLSALSAFSPIGNSGDLIPTALRPGIENAANHNFFSGLPIVSDSKKNYPAPFQTSKSTPAIYNQIGSLTNQSPNMIQNLARGYGTGYARLAELVTQPLSNTDNYSGQDINNVPVVRRFVGGAKKSPEEAQQNLLYQQQAVQKQIQDIRTGVKYGNIPYEDGMNQINTLMQQNQEKLKTQPQSYFGPQGASASTDATNPQAKLKLQMALDQAKMKVEQSGKPITLASGDIVYKNDNGNPAVLSLQPPTKGQGIDAFTNKNWSTNKALEVYKTNIPQAQKDQAYKKLGVDPADMEYAYKANKSTDIKVQYTVNQNLSHQQLLERMMTGRVTSVAGDMFASNGVIDALATQGLLSKAEAKYFKSIKLDKTGKSLTGSTGSTGGTGKGKALATLAKKSHMELAKLFQSQIKNELPSNAKNLEKVLQARSPQNNGLKSIQSILSQSEATVKKKRNLNAILGGASL